MEFRIFLEFKYTLHVNFLLDDFTPASIDKNQEGKVTIGSKLDVQIQVPHIDVSFFY